MFIIQANKHLNKSAFSRDDSVDHDLVGVEFLLQTLLARKTGPLVVWYCSKKTKQNKIKSLRCLIIAEPVALNNDSYPGIYLFGLKSTTLTSQ